MTKIDLLTKLAPFDENIQLKIWDITKSEYTDISLKYMCNLDKGEPSAMIAIEPKGAINVR